MTKDTEILAPSEPPTSVPRGPGHSCPVRGANANANANSGIPKQLDYFLVSRRVRALVKNCEATKELDMNSDHKGLKLRVKMKPQQRKKREKKQKNSGSWPPHSIEEFQEKTHKMFE